jgi:ubiquinone/menaquinone biosynthesis C-methylase UbiE
MVNFDERAGDWDNDPVKLERANRVAEGMRRQVSLNRELTALEYGCGTGLLSFALQDDLGQITLADSSPGMLAVLAQKISMAGIHNMTPLRLDLSTDPQPEERFDLIYTLMVLHHIPDTKKILRHFYDLLKKPGAVCIADLDQEHGSFHGQDFDGHKGFDRELLRHWLELTGFLNIRFESVYHMERAMDGHKKTFPLFLVCAEKTFKEGNASPG